MPITTLVRRILTYFYGTIVSIIIGAIGGLVCGTIILFVGNFCGNSGTTGTEYFGYIGLDLASEGALLVGVPVGMFVAPIAYLLFLRKTTLLRAVVVGGGATIAGGIWGAAAIGPLLAIFTAPVAFFIASCWLAIAESEGR